MDKLLLKLRESWLYMQEGVDDKHIFKAIFTAGVPGAGKTTLSKQVFAGTGFREVNIDRFVEFMAKKKNLDMKKMDTFGSEFFDKTDSMVSQSKKNYIDGRLPLILDGTGRNYERIASSKRELESLGYECGLLMVVTDLETAKKRNLSRERSVDDEYLVSSYTEVMNNLKKFQELFGNSMFTFDNSTGDDIKEIQKKINRFINTPVKNPVALQWINKQKGLY